MAKLIVSASEQEDRLILSGDIGVVLSSRRASRLLHDAIHVLSEGNEFVVSTGDDIFRTIDNLKRVAQIARCDFEMQAEAQSRLSAYEDEDRKFAEFSQKALRIRNNDCDHADFSDFKLSLERNLPCRRLYDLQLLSAYHLAFSQNGCNFSVPGAGKTSIVYGAYAYLKNLPEDSPKKVDRLLIISPLNAFGPWELEFAECFGRTPQSKRLVGGMSIDEKKQYLYELDPAELTLLSYASVLSLQEELRHFLTANRTMVVLDEAHKIKNTNGGVISETIGSLAPFAASRVVLTGTPAPNGYEDVFNLFKFIWPHKRIVRYQIGQLKDMTRNRNDPRIQDLLDSVSPYFLRIKKSDLHIPKATEHDPIRVAMKPSQRKIYDAIERRVVEELWAGHDRAFLAELARARMIRLMQAATNPALLLRPLDEFISGGGASPGGLSDDRSLIAEVMRFSQQEIPAKFEAALSLVKEIISRGEKVIVWACFIRNIDALREFFLKNGIDSRVLYGGTPVAGGQIDEEDPEYIKTRESIVAEFHKAGCPYQVLIANPFAVAESISLHKACHNAIYLERSFNAAHFLQSKDRIHRYGLNQDVQTNYYYLISSDSVDETIHARLIDKERRLLRIIESMPIPLFDNVEDGIGDEEIKMLMRDYARRSKEI